MILFSLLMRGFCYFRMMYVAEEVENGAKKKKKKSDSSGLSVANQIRIHKIPKSGDFPRLQIHLMLKSPFSPLQNVAWAVLLCKAVFW